MSEKSKILLIYTGGTIGMVHDKRGTLVPFDFHTQMDSFLAHDLEIEVEVHAFSDPIDSSDVDPEDWKAIGQVIVDNYKAYDGFIVLHGTDTMSYSASALSFMLEGLNKPVIFTGSQLPIGAARSDARENLMSSLEIAAKKIEGRPKVTEVCVYFSGMLLRGNRSRKVQSVHFDAFESENYPPLAQAGVTIDFNQRLLSPYQPNAQLIFRHRMDAHVTILKLFPGIRKEVVDCVLNTPGIKGVVVETYGSGNAPTNDWFIQSLEAANKRGILLYNVSQCSGGRVMLGKYESSLYLKEIGMISGGDITTEAAITKMMYLLGEVDDLKMVRYLLTTPIRGEMA
ncbi:MAG: asparaginase [Bacteroidota bacterium]